MLMKCLLSVFNSLFPRLRDLKASNEQHPKQSPKASRHLEIREGGDKLEEKF